jgi:linolenate 9R-lipoxygenase
MLTPLLQPDDREQFVYYRSLAGQDIPRFDPSRPLPHRAFPSLRLVANMGLGKIPVAPVASLELLGIAGVAVVINKLASPAAMPANFTRCRPDKWDDEFFVERRLNGFNPGQLRRVENPDWQYVICYDCRPYNFKFDKPDAIFPPVIEARFVLRDQSLTIHSIAYELNGQSISNAPGDANDWEWAKRLFRCVEIVFQEAQSHLGRAHLNVEQYAMAYYRNIVDNPIKELLAPHFEGVLYVNKLGNSDIFGPDGILPQTSALHGDEVVTLMRETITQLNYHGWEPDTIPDLVTNNLFDRAAVAAWKIIKEYVADFFTKHGTEILRLWPEIDGMSDDLVTHSILASQDETLKIANIDELQQLCAYVIYHSSFLHSWLNYKQYDDVGDVEYASIGLWDDQHDPADVTQKHIRQVLVAWSLSQIRYNPIMGEADPNSPIAILKDLLWDGRGNITPGLPLELFMASVHV